MPLGPGGVRPGLEKQPAVELQKDLAEDPQRRSSADVAARLLTVARTPQARWAVTVAALENKVLNELNGKTTHKRVKELLSGVSCYPGVAQDQVAIAGRRGGAAPGARSRAGAVRC